MVEEGPSTKPCGMLELRVELVEQVFPGLTCSGLLVRKSSIQLQVEVLMPDLQA